jgi:hypothetical protein
MKASGSTLSHDTAEGSTVLSICIVFMIQSQTLNTALFNAAINFNARRTDPYLTRPPEKIKLASSLFTTSKTAVIR